MTASVRRNARLVGFVNGEGEETAVLARDDAVRARALPVSDPARAITIVSLTRAVPYALGLGRTRTLTWSRTCV
jgi:hypothetical protein